MTTLSRKSNNRMRTCVDVGNRKWCRLSTQRTKQEREETLDKHSNFFYLINKFTSSHRFASHEHMSTTTKGVFHEIVIFLCLFIHSSIHPLIFSLFHRMHRTTEWRQHTMRASEKPLNGWNHPKRTRWKMINARFCCGESNVGKSDRK